jgi:hypothetical protein
MKWIGQHIWDFISRFRNDVYLEDVSDGDPDGDKFLCLDGNGKVVRATPPNTDTTYSISCVDGDNTDEEKIRLTAGGGGSGTDDVVLEVGTGLSIARSGDKITFTNTVTDTDTNTQNTTTLSFVDSTNDIILRNTTGGAGSGTDDIKFVAGANITLTHTDADNITIASTDTNTQLTLIDSDTMAGALSTNVASAESVKYYFDDNIQMTYDTNWDWLLSTHAISDGDKVFFPWSPVLGWATTGKPSQAGNIGNFIIAPYDGKITRLVMSYERDVAITRVVKMYVDDGTTLGDNYVSGTVAGPSNNYKTSSLTMSGGLDNVKDVAPSWEFDQGDYISLVIEDELTSGTGNAYTDKNFMSITILYNKNSGS